MLLCGRGEIGVFTLEQAFQLRNYEQNKFFLHYTKLMWCAMQCIMVKKGTTLDFS
jgi:hypothetical protein